MEIMFAARAAAVLLAFAAAAAAAVAAAAAAAAAQQVVALPPRRVRVDAVVEVDGNATHGAGQYSQAMAPPAGNADGVALLLAYHQQSNHAVPPPHGIGTAKVAACLDARCARVERRVIGAGGKMLKAALSPRDGLPVMAYFRHGDLVFARCADYRCASTSVVTLHANTTRHGRVGAYTSVAFAPDGSPLVGYWWSERRRAVVASCADPLCRQHTRTVLHDPLVVERIALLADDSGGGGGGSGGGDDDDDDELPAAAQASTSTSTSASSARGEFPAVTVTTRADGGAALHVVSYTAGTARLASCALRGGTAAVVDGSCRFGAADDSSSPHVGQYAAIATATRAQRPVALYVDSARYRLLAATCKTPGCMLDGAGAARPSVVDPAIANARACPGRGSCPYGEFPTIAALPNAPPGDDGDDWFGVSYFNQTSATRGCLKFAFAQLRAHDAALVTRNYTTLACGQGGFGRDSDFALLRDGSGSVAVSMLDYMQLGSQHMRLRVVFTTWLAS